MYPVLELPRAVLLPCNRLTVNAASPAARAVAQICTEQCSENPNGISIVVASQRVVVGEIATLALVTSATPDRIELKGLIAGAFKFSTSELQALLRERSIDVRASMLAQRLDELPDRHFVQPENPLGALGLKARFQVMTFIMISVVVAGSAGIAAIAVTVMPREIAMGFASVAGVIALVVLAFRYFQARRMKRILNTVDRSGVAHDNARGDNNGFRS